MNEEHARLLNAGWWADALRQRHALDQLAHAENRGHQAVSEARPDKPVTPAYELTDWDKAWIVGRVKDAHEQHVSRAMAARELLEESAQEHLARVQRDRAMRDFGATHEHTLKNAQALHARRRHEGAEGDELREIEQHVDYIKRHVATGEAEVSAARHQAADHLDDLECLSEKTYDEHVQDALTLVVEDLRSYVAPPFEPSPAAEPAQLEADIGGNDDGEQLDDDGQP